MNLFPKRDSMNEFSIIRSTLLSQLAADSAHKKQVKEHTLLEWNAIDFCFIQLSVICDLLNLDVLRSEYKSSLFVKLVWSFDEKVLQSGLSNFSKFLFLWKKNVLLLAVRKSWSFERTILWTGWVFCLFYLFLKDTINRYRMESRKERWWWGIRKFVHLFSGISHRFYQNCALIES